MTTALGKRKEREDDGTNHGSTLFVSNLPYTATSTDLQTLFSDIAPVRSAFVVLQHDTGISKGVGYVSFAIREDAQLAFEQIAKEGLLLDGRALRAQWADSKPKDGEPKLKHAEVTSKKETKSPVVPRTPRTPISRDPDAIRTVVIAGLPASADSKVLWKKLRKLAGAEKVEWPITSSTGEEDPSTAHALFSTPHTAQEAVNKLHAHVFKGALLSATLKKRLDGLAKVSKAPQASARPGTAPSRASRLIVRNLPWDITEQDLRAVFLPYGPIHSVHIPVEKVQPEDAAEEQAEGQVEKEKRKPRAKGFAFVWMLSKKDAEKAMEGCNGMTMRGGMAQGLVADKQKRKKQRREEKKAKEGAKAKAEGGEDDEGAESGDEEKGGAERIIAVDWALSKDKWEEEKAKMKIDEEDAKDEEEDVEMKDGDVSESGSDDEDDRLGVHDGSDADSNSDASSNDSSSDDDDEDEPARPQLPPPETGTTLFVRNVPFEATDDELRTLFRAFGPLRYARITMDPELGRSRGSGFVCFWNKTDADKAIAQSEILRSETTGGDAAPRKNPFKLPSLLTPDPSASMAQNLVLQGRTLDVIRAVTRDEAGKLKEAGERQREKADKRNLYLLREGIIMPNSPAADSLSAAELEKRTTSFNSRRALLRSNPSLFVSRTRLSVRQLPIFVTERMLKRLAIYAVRAFNAEVKSGARPALSADELAVLADAEDDEDAEPAPRGKGKPTKGGRNTGVQQAKIVRQLDRVDPVTGKGRSRGYGFLEMATHADALRVLRWANNNPAVGPLFEGWWKEELADLVKAEGKKEKEKRDDARLKRMKEEVEKEQGEERRKSRGSLIMEFSIENIQVVQRRAAHQRENPDTPATGEKKGRQPLSLPPKSETESVRPTKKRRADSARPKLATTKQEPAKGEQKLGSLIGRKRKERKTKKRAS